MKPAFSNPQDIERRSFEIITGELACRSNVLARTALEQEVLTRVIHTTADFDFAETLVFTNSAAETGAELLRSGAIIVTDTNMALAGINKPLLGKCGSEAFCYIACDDVVRTAKKDGITRAVAAVDKAALLHGEDRPLIFAVGNAPTALFRIHELVARGSLKPALIIACPVGFVNVVESKELIMELAAPAVIARGRKGGSAVAAAVVNALLRQILA